MRPDVALAFDRMAAAARRDAGLFLIVSSGYRSDAEQARLVAAQPNPHLFSALQSGSETLHSGQSSEVAGSNPAPAMSL
jgi:hypothetical protein